MADEKNPPPEDKIGTKPERRGYEKGLPPSKGAPKPWPPTGPPAPPKKKNP